MHTTHTCVYVSMWVRVYGRYGRTGVWGLNAAAACYLKHVVRTGSDVRSVPRAAFVPLPGGSSRSWSITSCWRRWREDSHNLGRQGEDKMFAPSEGRRDFVDSSLATLGWFGGVFRSADCIMHGVWYGWIKGPQTWADLVFDRHEKKPRGRSFTWPKNAVGL